MSETGPRPLGFNPYRFAAAAAVTLAVAAGAGYEVGAEPTDSGSVVKEPPGHVYHDGETMQLLPGLPAKLDGWKVVISKAAIDGFRSHNPDDNVAIRLVTPGSMDNNPPDLEFDIGSVLSDGASDDKDSYSIIGEPVAHEPSYLIVQLNREELTGTKLREIPLKAKTFNLGFKSYHEARRQKGAFVEPMIFSEANVGQEKLNEVGALVNQFGGFINPPDIYVFHSDDEITRGGDYNSQAGIGEMGSLSFTKPLFKGEHLAIAYHELSHALLQDLLDQQNDQGPVVKMISAYNQLIHAAGFHIPIPEGGLLGPDPSLEDSPVINIFDESHYTPPLKAKGVLYGHPYSNFNELFASAMTVMRFFPDKFAEKFQQLSPQHRAAVMNVVLTIDSVLRSFPDASHKDIETLQPSLDRLKELQ